jgi:hypothetical protein
MALIFLSTPTKHRHSAKRIPYLANSIILVLLHRGTVHDPFQVIIFFSDILSYNRRIPYAGIHDIIMLSHVRFAVALEVESTLVGLLSKVFSNFISYQHQQEPAPGRFLSRVLSEVPQSACPPRQAPLHHPSPPSSPRHTLPSVLPYPEGWTWNHQRQFLTLDSDNRRGAFGTVSKILSASNCTLTAHRSWTDLPHPDKAQGNRPELSTRKGKRTEFPSNLALRPVHSSRYLGQATTSLSVFTHQPEASVHEGACPRPGQGEGDTPVKKSSHMLGKQTVDSPG